MQFLQRLEQICMEDKYNREQIVDFIRKEIEAHKELLEPCRKRALEALYAYFDKEYSYDSKNTRLDALMLREDFSIEDILDQVVLLTIAESKPTKIQKIVGKLAPYFKYEDIWDGVRTAAEILAVIQGPRSYFTLVPARTSESGSIELVSNFQLNPEVLNKIEEMQYLPPLLCKPGKIHHNHQSAYLTKDDSIILGKNNHHDEPQALDVVNISNAIALSLDENILKLEERSKKPLDTTEKLLNWQRLVASSRKVYDEMLEKGNKFYLSWKYDTRGRTYSLGYHVNIQSTEYKKALINFHKKEIIELEHKHE